MRISDWSSDVCSSDLVDGEDLRPEARELVGPLVGQHDADQERDQPDDGQRVEARLLHVGDQRHRADAPGLQQRAQQHGDSEAEEGDQVPGLAAPAQGLARSEEQTYELQSLMPNSYT